jgi:AraC-like DNA-binding protein
MPIGIEVQPDLRSGRAALSGRPITVFRGDYASGKHLTAHRHARGQLAYAAGGIMTVTTEGTATKQGGAWVVPPSQALWIPPRLTHAIRMTGKVAMRTLYLRSDAAGFMPDAPRVLAVSPLLRELILRMMEASPRGDHGGHMTALILEELRAAPSLKLRLPMPRDERLLRLCRTLLEQPGDARKLPKLARIAGASTRSLARLFQAELGMSFTAWRQQAQLMEALRRLAEGTPVTDVGLDLGYATPSAFTYMFRRALGIAPSRYFERGERQSNVKQASRGRRS